MVGGHRLDEPAWRPVDERGNGTATTGGRARPLPQRALVLRPQPPLLRPARSLEISRDPRDQPRSQLRPARSLVGSISRTISGPISGSISRAQPSGGGARLALGLGAGRSESAVVSARSGTVLEIEQRCGELVVSTVLGRSAPVSTTNNLSVPLRYSASLGAVRVCGSRQIINHLVIEPLQKRRGTVPPS